MARFLNRALGGLLLLGIATGSPASAKKPAQADEAAVREIVRQIYADYTRVIDVEGPDYATEGYVPPYSKSLDALIQTWMPYGGGEEILSMNGFDWYCQCQDSDPTAAKLNGQKYDAKGEARIQAIINFAPVGGEGAPLTINFVREGSDWTIDDLRFEDGSTLRQGLAQDINDGAKL